MGGLAFSRLVTLHVTPVLYTYLDPVNQRLKRKLAREEKRQPGGEQMELGVR